MKRLIYAMVILGGLMANAQTSENIQNDFFEHLETDAIILTDEGPIKDASEVKSFTSNFKESIYIKDFSIEVNSVLNYEIGEIQSNSRSYAVMFIKTKADGLEAKIEFLIINEKSNSENELSAMDQSRKAWMTLCNAHQAEKLVEQVYLTDAYYYNRGRLIQGTKALSSEYSYMNSPNYSLKLSPKHIVMVNSDIAYELGQCSGSYPLPYLLVWKKQDDGKWLILMDANY